ncbi:MAG: FtsX-like permease family protein [Caldithrix sp.]|nr:FtsX-like permease family protein [Caldithrix sp.]
MIRFILKGVLRDRSRSLIPVLIVAIGVTLTVLIYGWMNGVVDNLMRTNAYYNTGHLKVATRAYWTEAEQLPNDLALTGMDRLLTFLHKNYPDVEWKPRIRFGGLLDIPGPNDETREQGPTAGIALDLFESGKWAERRLFKLQESLVKGRLPRTQNEVLLSNQMARSMNIDMGDEATLIGSTMYGGMAMYNFKVVGVLTFGVQLLDRGSMIAHLNAVQRALNMDNACSEIYGIFKNDIYSAERAADIKQDFNRQKSKPDDAFSPQMKLLTDQQGLGELLPVYRSAWLVLLLIFVAAMSIVLWNAGLMAGIRRYGEIGVRLAMGEDKGHLYRMMIAESVIIGLIGSVLGTAIGLAGTYYLQSVGVDISGFMEDASMFIMDRVRARVTPTSYVIGFIPGLLATILGTSISGIGIYKRQTSQLFKELET